MDPETATFDKKTELQEDVVFTVMGNAPIENIKIGAATVNPANYTIADNVVTLKKEYLATLAVGDKAFTLVFNGVTLAVTVTILETT